MIWYLFGIWSRILFLLHLTPNILRSSSLNYLFCFMVSMYAYKNTVPLSIRCSFDEFLMDMKQSKRKNIRQERKKVSFFLNS